MGGAGNTGVGAVISGETWAGFIFYSFFFFFFVINSVYTADCTCGF